MKWIKIYDILEKRIVYLGRNKTTAIAFYKKCEWASIGVSKISENGPWWSISYNDLLYLKMEK